MMKKIMTFFVLNVLLIGSAFAKNIIVDVNGLVCEFCASTIEKAFLKKKDIVETVKVDLANKKVVIGLKTKQDISDEEVKDIVINNGYNVVGIHRE